MEELKGYIVGIISRWLFKLAGGFLIGWGYTADSSLLEITGVVAFVVGIVISFIQHKKAVNQPT